MPFTYEYPRPSLTVDVVVFGFDPTNERDPLQVLLIRRNEPPFEGAWALPGGHVHVSDEGNQGESLETAALRELNEETGLKVEYIEQLYTFATPGRDPRGRVVSVAYFALVRSADHRPMAGSDAAEASWFGLDRIVRHQLAFDHGQILTTALTRLEGKVRYAPIGFNLLPSEFTLPEMQLLYEAVLQRRLDASNFRKRILAMGILKETGEKASSGVGRPASLYRFDKKAYDRAVKGGFNFEV